MSGTNANYSGGAGGVSLPAPVVRLGKNAMGTTYECAKGKPSDGNTYTVLPLTIATVSVHGLPQAVMEDLAAFAPKLELLRYVSVRSRQQNRGRNLTHSGYVHPAHGPAPSGNGSYTHGGMHSAVPSTVQAIRPTEWDVTAWGQVIDVTQGMHGFMNLDAVTYREPTVGPAQVTNTIDALVPSGARSSSNGMGRRFPYRRNFRPGYYKFRWSIIDPTDSRGQRITGATSETVALSNDVFPFIPAESWFNPLDNDYNATATIDPRHDPSLTRMWVGSVSRLPR